jgi:hypothetical protein
VEPKASGESDMAWSLRFAEDRFVADDRWRTEKRSAGTRQLARKQT